MARSAGADSMGGAADWYGAICFVNLRSVESDLAARTEAQSDARANLMLGVNATTDSVSRFKKVAWRRTLGWKEAVSRKLSAFSKTHTRLGGQLVKTSEDDI
jgi:hypothetical protein